KRSSTRSLIKSAATFFKASKRLGFKSRESIEPETSVAKTISTPFVILDFVLLSIVCGRANAIINASKATARNTKSSGYNFVSRVFLFLNPCTVLIFTGTFSFFRLMYQYHPKGNKSKSNQKKFGFKKVILFI